jgi:predicted transcriptional regulator
VEIKVAFDFSDSDISDVIDKLIKKDLIKQIPAGNSYFIEPALSPMACDDNSGFCRI